MLFHRRSRLSLYFSIVLLMPWLFSNPSQDRLILECENTTFFPRDFGANTNRYCSLLNFIVHLFCTKCTSCANAWKTG
jgi:hypothetical protein